MKKMVVYDGWADKKAKPTKHTLAMTSAGKCTNGRYDTMTLRKNGRKDWSLFYCFAGCVTFDGTPLLPGMLWLYEPDVPQKYLVDCGVPTEYGYLHFSGSCVEELIASLGIPRRRPFPASSGAAAETFGQLAALSGKGDPRANLEAEALMLRMLVSIAPRENRRTEPRNLLSRITDEMAHNYFLPYDAKAYAARLGVSVSRFNHLFTEVNGTPPQRYFMDLRMNEARLLLEGTRLPVADVACHVGYSDPLYFGRLFRKRFGVSPTAWRKRFL